MNKDRIQGSVEQAKGKVKEVAGKMTGDAKLETEGKTQRHHQRRYLSEIANRQPTFLAGAD